MPSAGFIGASASRYRKRRGTGTTGILAVTVPATSELVVGQALQDTLNWNILLDPANYSTTAPGESIADVSVSYTGSTANASEAFVDGGTNTFIITVTDTAGNARLFSTIPRTVVYGAPTLDAALSDLSVIRATGLATYESAAVFSGTALVFEISGPTGVVIDSVTGVVSLDTDVLIEQADTLVTVTARNSGGSVATSFLLNVTAPILYSTAISGLVPNPTHGDTAQIGTALTGTIANLIGTETIVHRWLRDGTVISESTSATYAPVASDDLAVLQYAPLINGTAEPSTAYIVRHVPPVGGSFAPVVETQGNGTPTVNLTAGFTGQALVYSENVAWAAITGSTLTIEDALRNETLTITATNSGGQAQVSLGVTISQAPPETAFVFTHEVINPNDSFTIPFRNLGTYSGTVDMGNGAGPQPYSAWNDPAFTATYATPGIKTVRVEGTAGHIQFFGASPSSFRVRTVENLGLMGWRSMQEAFTNCTGLTSFTAGNTDTSAVSNWFGTFKNCNSMVTCDLVGMDFSSAGPMGQMFRECPSIQEPFDFTVIANTAAPIFMDEMFRNDPAGPDLPNLDPSGLDISNLQDNGGYGGGLFDFLNNRNLSTAVYDQLLINWAAQLPTPNPFDPEQREGFICDFQLSQPTMSNPAVVQARRDLIDAGFFLEDAEITAPEQMTAPVLTADSETQITIMRGAAPFAGGLPIRYYDYRYSTDETNWTVVAGGLDDHWTSKVLTGLIVDTQYYVQIRARAPVTGGGVWSTSSVVSTFAGPQPFAATRQGSDLVLTDVPDISLQTFTAEVQGADLVISFTAPIVTPTPTQVAVIEAVNHDGTGPDAGNYDVQIFDLGTGVGDTYTLGGAAVPIGAMVVLLDPRSDVVGGGATEFERVVFVGASIMEQAFGSSLTTRNAVAEAAFRTQGAQVEVYAHATSGFDAGQIQTLLSQAMAAFPDKTLFFVHAGGNNVSANRPYPGGQSTLAAQLNGLVDIAANRPGSVVISDLTFRDYGDTTASNEAAGSKPYNDGLYLPTFQARSNDLLARAYYADGTPVSCLYEWSFDNRSTYLSADNIHPANPGGRELLRGWLAERLAPICLGLPAPAQFTRPAASIQFTDNQNGTVTLTAAGSPPPASFFDNQDGTVQRTN